MEAGKKEYIWDIVMISKHEQGHGTARRHSSLSFPLLYPSSNQACPRLVCNRSKNPKSSTLARCLPQPYHTTITGDRNCPKVTTRWHFSGSTYPAGAIFGSVRWELKSVCLLQTVKNGFYNETEHIVSFIFKLWHLEHTHH